MVTERRSSGTLAEMERGAGQDSERWFGDQNVVHDIAYNALCLAGEVGEFCNLVKKAARGSVDPKEAKFRYDLSMELADIFTYMLNLGNIMGIDLEALYYVKRDINEKRFTVQRAEREAAASGGSKHPGTVTSLRRDGDRETPDGSS